MRSVKAKLFSNVASVVTTGAPRKTERGEFPKVYGAGFTNADGSNQSRPSSGRLSTKPSGSDGERRMSGRFARPLLAPRTSSGSPAVAVVIVLSCHPPAIAFPTRLPVSKRFPLPNGSS